jgi:hypothetical protein
MSELEEAGYLEEPSPEDCRDLEESAERALERGKLKGLAKDYPKSCSRLASQWSALLKNLTGSLPADDKDLTRALQGIVDRARDLEEIEKRLLQEKHTKVEIGELLFAFDAMVQHIRSYSITLENYLLEVFDKVKGLKPIP